MAGTVAGWKRPEDIDGSPSVFLDRIEPGDIAQGALGDCWLLSVRAPLFYVCVYVCVCCTKGGVRPHLIE